MQIPATVGANVARILGGLRAANDSVTWKGGTYAAIVKSYEERAVPDYVLQGPGRSAGNKNGYEVSLTPAEFGAGPVPDVGDALGWQGMALTVARRVPVPLFESVADLRYIVYQAPAVPPTPGDAAQAAKWT